MNLARIILKTGNQKGDTCVFGEDDLAKWKGVTRVFDEDTIWGSPCPGASKDRCYTGRGTFNFGVTRALARFLYCTCFFYEDVQVVP